MKARKNFFKKVISFYVILCIILSLGYNIKTLKSLKIEKQHFRYEIGNLIVWEQLITTVRSNIKLTTTKQVVKNDESEVFWVILQNIQGRLGYLLYRKVMFTGFLMSIFYRIIIYIHNKDGPKPMISPI